MSPKTTPVMNPERRVLYCHCAFARVVPNEVKEGVLKGLASSDTAFEAVPDLCELAARQDPSLKRLASGGGPLEIVACYPRAVRWLFHAAEAPLPEEGVRVHNMRVLDAEATLEAVFNPDAAATEEPVTARETAVVEDTVAAEETVVVKETVAVEETV